MKRSLFVFALCMSFYLSFVAQASANPLFCGSVFSNKISVWPFSVSAEIAKAEVGLASAGEIQHEFIVAMAEHILQRIPDSLSWRTTAVEKFVESLTEKDLARFSLKRSQLGSLSRKGLLSEFQKAKETQKMNLNWLADFIARVLFLESFRFDMVFTRGTVNARLGTYSIFRESIMVMQKRGVLPLPYLGVAEPQHFAQTWAKRVAIMGIINQTMRFDGRYFRITPFDFYVHDPLHAAFFYEGIMMDNRFDEGQFLADLAEVDAFSDLMNEEIQNQYAEEVESVVLRRNQLLNFHWWLMHETVPKRYIKFFARGDYGLNPVLQGRLVDQITDRHHMGWMQPPGWRQWNDDEQMQWISDLWFDYMKVYANAYRRHKDRVD